MIGTNDMDISVGLKIDIDSFFKFHKYHSATKTTNTTMSCLNDVVSFVRILIKTAAISVYDHRKFYGQKSNRKKHVLM